MTNQTNSFLQLLSLFLFVAAQPIAMSPPGYTCFAATDIVGQTCDLKRIAASNNLTLLAEQCNHQHTLDNCRGFNTNGWLKRCVRPSCGAKLKALSDHKTLVSCYWTATPTDEPVPPGCPPPHPSPSPPSPAPPAPSPSPPPPPPPTPPPNQPIFNCTYTAYRPDCNCSGSHPPFAAPTKTAIPLLDDYHYPSSEAAELAAVLEAMPVLERTGVSATTTSSTAYFIIPSTGHRFELTVGKGSAYGWSLAAVMVKVALTNQDRAIAVIEKSFQEWGLLVYLQTNATKPLRTMRKPVGVLSSIREPRYALEKEVDPDFKCKQDIDPTDFLTTCASSISPGKEEVSIAAAISVLEPNPDSALFGNPEELNKWSLRHDGVVGSWPWPPGKTRASPTQIWELANILPEGCAPAKHASWDDTKMGMLGRYLRVANQGVWSAATTSTTANGGAGDGGGDGGGGCGAEVMAVSPQLTAENETSVALIRIKVLDTRTNRSALPYFKYVELVVNQTSSQLISNKTLADSNSFFVAVEAQDQRWTYDWVPNGAVPHFPPVDQRYADTAIALLTMYQNLDRGLIPQYGGGKFWNDYNTFLPLDTLALNGALLEWGHVKDAQRYLTYFFKSKINATDGSIIYNIFGCDSDADYGRLIAMFAHAVEYGGDEKWAATLLPIVHAMTQNILSKRSAAKAAFAPGSPLHGIVAGSPEHDICGAPGHFFSVNVWHARSLLDLGRMHEEHPALSINPALEKLLVPVGSDWRNDINFAANFTAVRKSNGDVFFLHPVVGAAYGSKAGTPAGPPLHNGGVESTCVQRKTCFSSMTAVTPDGAASQEQNYANFRIFSETLLAGILSPAYEIGIMNYRESHRGTLLGMTRFRDGLDDMPILGYGAGALRHDRTNSFHALLAGHTLNYLTRGTQWGTEQRQQIDWTSDDGKYRNNCGIGGEDCSLCMVSSVASSYWVRWMMVVANPDENTVHVASGAPRRWYYSGVDGGSVGGGSSNRFGIDSAPTRLGSVSFSIDTAAAVVVTNGSSLAANHVAIAAADTPTPTTVVTTTTVVKGWVALAPTYSNGAIRAERIAVKLRTSSASDAPIHGSSIEVTSGDATLSAWYAGNETAVFRVGASKNFSFAAAY